MATKISICAGFDGSAGGADTGDWTALRCETSEGYQFTYRYGENKRPSYWDPREWGSTIPRHEVSACIEELFDRFDVKRVYCDPPYWETDIEAWALRYGEQKIVKFQTGVVTRMHPALSRFKTDLSSGRITHDDCKQTAVQVGNAATFQKPGDRFLIGKPIGSYSRKIDLTMASVLAHEAAADSRAGGWTSTRRKTLIAMG